MGWWYSCFSVCSPSLSLKMFGRNIISIVLALLNIIFGFFEREDKGVYVFGEENHPSCSLFTMNFWRSAGNMCVCACNMLAE